MPIGVTEELAAYLEAARRRLESTVLKSREDLEKIDMEVDTALENSQKHSQATRRFFEKYGGPKEWGIERLVQVQNALPKDVLELISRLAEQQLKEGGR